MAASAELFCDLIASHSGRDKVMKVLCYTAKVLSTPNSTIKIDNAKKFYIFSSRISQARATLRLVDDLPTILYALEYGLGRHEKNRFDALLGVLTNIVDILFFPVDKICWLSDHNILQLDETKKSKWDVINSVFWSLSVFLNLSRVLRDYHEKHIAGALLMKERAVGNVTNDDAEMARKRYEQQRIMESITVLRMSLDLVHAVSSLPKGYLWGGEIKSWKVGVIGSLSGLLGIYQYVVKIKKSKKH
ncbi:peroxisomal membrane protein 11C [Episyrphus balteatus]|uniref:peroxisomal membrane protein 11C n=1 Tax=Episyrphus balteatus TaxID=286459 RepID=UPI002484E5F6|nr:peroxisomal membrane protein 11C [Episyrphus balteatus]